MKFKLNLLIPFFIAIFLISIINIINSYYQKKDAIFQSKEKVGSIFEKSLEENVETISKELEVNIDFIQNRNDIAMLFKQKSKQKLYKQIQKIYKNLNNKVDLTHMYFIEPNGKVLLRAHDYERDLDIINRKTFEISKKTQEVSSGLEFGPKKNYTLRVVKPWYFEGKLIGYLELGKEIDKILDDISKTLQTQIYIAAHENIYKESPQYIQEKLKKLKKFNNHYIVYNTFEVPDQIKIALNNGDFNYAEVEFNTKEYFLSKIPLRDISLTNLGYFIFLTDITIEQKAINKSMKNIIFIFVISSLILMLVAYFLIRDREKSINLLNEKINEHAEYLKSLFTIVPIGIGVVENRIIKEVNPYFTSLLGYSKEELMDKSSRMLYPSDKEFEEVGKINYEQIRKYGTGKAESRLRSKNGKLIDVIIASTPIDQDDFTKGIIFTVQDITELKNTEKEILLAKEKYRCLIEEIDEWIWEMNSQGTIIYTSPISKKILGYEVDEIQGKHFDNFLPKEESPRINSLFKVHALNNRPLNDLLVKCIHKNGNEVILGMNCFPKVDDKGICNGFRGVNKDITQKIKMKEELKHKEELMLAQSRQAAMGDMISMIAHQWRQPLSVISMSVNNLKVDIAFDEEISKESIEEYTNVIVRQIEHLTKTIDDFKDFFKPNKEKKLVTIASVINDAMNIIGKSLQNNNISVNINIDPEFKIYTYSNELLQVVLNLIGNAKYVLKDKKDALLKIEVTKLNDHYKISFCDNGGGIAPDILKNLGEPYISNKGKDGTGLGIYMSKTIVEKHLNGSLKWENTSEGACFIILLK